MTLDAHGRTAQNGPMSYSVASSQYLNKVIDLQEQGRCHVIARTDSATVFKVDGYTSKYMVTVIPDWAAEQLGIERWSCTCRWAREVGYESKPCSHALACVLLFDGADVPFTKGNQ